MQTYRIVVAVVAGILCAGAASAQRTSDEQKCMTATSKALAKHGDARQKCVAKCWASQRKGRVPTSDCVPPYGGATAACVSDVQKGVEAKALTLIAKACETDCPECYSGGDCAAEASSRVAEAASNFDLSAGNLWCDDSASPDGHTAGEAKCQDAAAKIAAQVIGSTAKCLDQCQQAVAKGALPPDACVYDDGESKFEQCVATAWLKGMFAIDKACVAPGLEPECYPTPPSIGFIPYVAFIYLDDEVSRTYCE